MFDKKLLESAELYDKRYKNFATLVIFPVTVLFVGLLLFVFFAQKELTVNTAGEIEPVKIIAQVQSTSSNTMTENNLVEGKIVKKNDLLIKYNSASDLVQLTSLEGQLKQAQDQQAALTLLQNSLNSGNSQFSQPDSFGYYQDYENYLAQAQNLTDNVNKSNQSVSDQNSASDNERSAIDNQINTINGQIADYQELENAASNNSSVSSSNPYLSQYSSYQSQLKADPANKAALQSQFLASVQSSITQLQSSAQSLSVQAAGLSDSNAYDYSLNSQLASLKAQEIEKANQEMTSLNSQLADLNTKVTLQKQANAYDAIPAPNSGVLHVLPNVLGLKAISAGTAIAQIYPNLARGTEVLITAYVSSTDISAVRQGMTLRLSVAQNLPEPLILSGKISHIDSAPTVGNGLNVYKLQAKVALTTSDLAKVRYGLQGKAVIITGEKTYFNYYKDKIINGD